MDRSGESDVPDEFQSGGELPKTYRVFELRIVREEPVFPEPRAQHPASIVPPRDRQGHIDQGVNDRGRNPRQPLNWFIQQLPRVENRVEVLADSSRHDEHRAAARDILATLQSGALSLLELRPRMPRIVTRADHEIPESKLLDLGMLLDTAIRAEGLLWPPPRTQPPPSVALDLLQMYRYGSHQRVALGENSWERLIPKLETVVSKSERLLKQLSAADAEKVRRIAGPEGEGRRSKIGMFLSGSALVISLIQGPGAVDDLPRDVVELGTDVRQVVSAIVRGSSHLIDIAVSEMRR